MGQASCSIIGRGIFIHTSGAGFSCLLDLLSKCLSRIYSVLRESMFKKILWPHFAGEIGYISCDKVSIDFLEEALRINELNCSASSSFQIGPPCPLQFMIHDCLSRGPRPGRGATQISEENSAPLLPFHRYPFSPFFYLNRAPRNTA